MNLGGIKLPSSTIQQGACHMEQAAEEVRTILQCFQDGYAACVEKYPTPRQPLGEWQAAQENHTVRIKLRG